MDRVWFVCVVGNPMEAAAAAAMRGIPCIVKGNDDLITDILVHISYEQKLRSWFHTNPRWLCVPIRENFSVGDIYFMSVYHVESNDLLPSVV